MQILSVNFGHDASFALFTQGRLVAFEELERRTRYKYHFGLKAEYIEDFLASAGLKFDDIDFVALCSTQGYAMAHCTGIGLERAWSPHHAALTPYHELWDDGLTHDRSTRDPWYEARHVVPQGLTESTPSPVRSEFGFPYLQGPGIDFIELTRLVSTATSLDERDLVQRKASFLSPYVMRLRDRQKPAFYVNHHTCHAYYAHFYSASGDSMVCTHDGAMPWKPFHSGGFYLSTADGGVLPIASHNLALGRLYDEMGEALGVGEAGKLMGLSAYATPSADVLELVPECFRIFQLAEAGESQMSALVERIIAISRQQRRPRSAALRKFRFDFPDVESAAQAAANTQYLVQTIFVDQVSAMAASVQAGNPGITCLDLAGGYTLNCPSNSLLQAKCRPLKVNPLPGAGDTGLAVGAGAAAADFLGGRVTRVLDSAGTSAAFPPSNLDHNNAHPDNLRKVRKTGLGTEDLPNFIARMLADGKVLCLHRGRSEVGPRALGHRSIIAHAVSEEIRDRINAAKGREAWRPLAPICRQEDFGEYFAGDRSMGRFMLFTCDVLNPVIPAVTHVDGTARVQCIDASDTWLHPALGLLKAQGHHPVIVNTSFNCAGEPIVETLDHAIASFLRMGFDYLVTELGVFAPQRPLS